MTAPTTTENIFKLTPYEEASLEVQAVYDDTKKTLGIPFVLNWFQCQGSNYTLLRGNWEKLKSTLVEGTVPNVLKQLIIYNVSRIRNCDYCADAHKIFADLMGKQIMGDTGKITDNMDSSQVPDSYKLAVDIVTEAALDSSAFDRRRINELFDAGFSAAEIQELMAQADLVNMLNTMANISGIKIDNELFELA